MANGTMEYRIDGTAALEMQELPTCTTGATVIPFPTNRENASGQLFSERLAHISSIFHTKAAAILEGSEMFCSLKYEDFRGCAYGLFSRRNIAVLSSATSVIAVVSVIAGA